VRTLSQLIAIAIVTSIFAHAQQPSNNPPSTLRFDNVRLHHVVERHFQHDLWLNHPPETLILNRVLQKLLVISAISASVKPEYAFPIFTNRSPSRTANGHGKRVGVRSDDPLAGLS